MIIKRFSVVLFITLIGSALNAADYSIHVTVAKDGSGDYTTIQAAIDAAPSNLTQPYVIFIKKGTYNEKLYIEKSFITLLGEDRDSTKIVTAELRRIWRETNPSDYGAATINIKDGVTDLTLANLTAINNFADVYPDVENNHDHTMTIRGGSGVTRIIIINCNIIATGGDTLSLWNTGGGMFYHLHSYFEGYVDYVCPRGYCYIEDCDFYGYNNNASIWHDGSGGIDHKLVIADSRFDGVRDFALGRYHKDAAFYLLNCSFSANMRDKDIYYVENTVIPQWGKRVYYYNCHKTNGDYPWHKDNLHLASDTLRPEDVTSLWTFNNQWNPENTITGLLEMAILPAPKNFRRKVPTDVKLTWISGRGAKSHLIYLGTDSIPPFIGTSDTSIFDPGRLEAGKTYFWHIDEVTETDTIRGEIWEFTTMPAAPPEQPVYIYPSNNAVIEERNVTFQWQAIPYITDTFYIYVDTVAQGLKQTGILTLPYFTLRNLQEGKKYYWRIDAMNSFGTISGQIWSFSVKAPVISLIPDKIINTGFYVDAPYPNPSNNEIIIRYYIPQPDRITISLYELTGRKIVTLFSEFQIEGNHFFVFRPKEYIGNNSSNNTFLCTLTYQSFIKSLVFHTF